MHDIDNSRISLYAHDNLILPKFLKSKIVRRHHVHPPPWLKGGKMHCNQSRDSDSVKKILAILILAKLEDLVKIVKFQRQSRLK